MGIDKKFDFITIVIKLYFILVKKWKYKPFLYQSEKVRFLLSTIFLSKNFIPLFQFIKPTLNPVFFLLVLSLFTITCFNPLQAQKFKGKPFQPSSSMLQTIQSDIKKIEKGWLNNDFTVIVKENLMHPKLIESKGGIDSVIHDIELIVNAMGNFKIEKVNCYNPKDFTTFNNIIYGIQPCKIIFNFDGNFVETEDFLLIMSENQGKSFYYFESSFLNEPLIEELFPDIKIGAKLPKNNF